MYKGETRQYEIEEIGRVYLLPVHHCVFCKYCNDLLYDYTNGPYMFFCDLGLEPTITETTCECPKFEDSGYVFDIDPIEYAERRKASNETTEELTNKIINYFKETIGEENMKKICESIIEGVKHD